MAKSSEKRFAVGVDYGTNSVRALVVDVSDGSDVATHVYDYPSGDAGILLDAGDPNLARQNPADYIQGFYESVGGAIRAAGKQRGFSRGQSRGHWRRHDRFDADPGRPARACRWRCSPPSARTWPRMPGCGKTTPGHAEAEEITQRAARHKDGYLKKCGGSYSSEWYWSKILHCRRVAPKVFAAAYAWVELADFIPGFITGNLDPDTMPRCICAAGHKAMYHEQWGGLPGKRVPQEPRSADCPPCAITTRLRRSAPISKAGELTADDRQDVWACRRASPWRPARSMRTWVPLGPASSRARW